MPIQEHELQLVVEAPGGDVNLQGTDDGELMAFDAATHAALAALEAAVAVVTSALGPKATQATLQAVLDALGGTLAVSAASLPLPAGAATQATLATLATQATLQLVKNRLDDIYSAVDGLEVTAENIEISSETINLQTDEVEALLQTLRDTLGLESTLQTILTRLGVITDPNDTQPVSVATLPLPTGAATEDTLAGFAVRQPGSLIDRPNMRTTLLGADEVFEGPWTHVEHHGSVLVLYAIQPVSEAPLTVQTQWSDDEATVLATSTIAQKQVVSGPFTYAVYLSILNGNFQGRYYRTKITNGPVAQTQVPIPFNALNKYPYGGTFSALDATLTFFSQALLVRAVLAGVKADGSFINMPVIGLDETITGTEDVSLTRSVIVGEQPDGTYFDERAPGISEDNSSTTPLAADAEFVGEWLDALGFVSATLIVRSDAQGASNGLAFDYSIDGVTADRSLTQTYDAAPAGRAFIVPILGRYMRVRYLNGAVLQTLFRMELKLDDVAQQQVLIDANDPLTADVLATVVRALIEPLANSPTQGSNESFGTAPVFLFTTPAGCKGFNITSHPSNTKIIRFGYSAGTQLWPLGAGASEYREVGPGVSVYAKTDSGSGAQVAWETMT